MTPGKSSALNRYYYSLSEATKVLKAHGKNLSVFDLLHYGVQGFVRFFIHLPSGIWARQILGSVQYENELTPSLMILSRLQCGEIECNKTTRHSDFPSAYANLYSYLEIPSCPKSPEFLEETHWQSVDRNDEITPIPITPKEIHIAHTELEQLIQQPDGPYRPPVEFTPQFDEQIQQDINLRCYSFEDALKTAKEKIDGFTEIDLLRYGYFEKLTLLVQRPKNLTIAIASHGNRNATKLRAIPEPHLLALYPEDCYQIEIFGRTKRIDFKVGFLCHYRTLIPAIPKPIPDLIIEILESSNPYSVHNYRLRVDTKTNGKLRWRTCNQSEPYALEINKNTIYVIRSEFDRLIAAESTANKIGQIDLPYTPEFTISDITNYYLSPKHFITLSDAATLAKCYTNELLIHASQGKIELLTPVPCEIALCQTHQPVNSIDKLWKSRTDIYASVEEIPQLLVLENEDCEAVATNGRFKKGYFKNGYSFKFSQLVQQTPFYLRYTRSFSRANTPISDSEKCRGVWLTFYLDKPKEIDLTVDRIFIELSKFQEFIKSSPVIFKSNNDIFIDSDPNDNVTIKEFMELSGLSRTTIDNKSKHRDKYPDFPRKIRDEDNVHVHFLRPEVDAWLRKNPPRNRKRKEK